MNETYFRLPPDYLLLFLKIVDNYALLSTRAEILTSFEQEMTNSKKAAGRRKNNKKNNKPKTNEFFESFLNNAKNYLVDTR